MNDAAEEPCEFLSRVRERHFLENMENMEYMEYMELNDEAIERLARGESYDDEP
ncbi:hypothetical protein HFN62_27635 [Rhizobium leguminosarum]|uniref:hypothetical protein n=1 Tax=Rhizobium leguminosarum TaxID=384 RepID=UPI001C93E730|nr:hypothetical protein [Rhizobium leguminosarum]MBY5787486.1 hypothetical protein [Rhizobium leguminosarum]